MRKRLIVKYSADEARIYTYLRKYLPSFLALLDPTPAQLRAIEAKIEIRYTQVATALKNSGEFRAETTLIDLFWKVDERNIHSMQFMRYIDKACRTIAERIPAKVLPGLKNTLFQLVVNFTKNCRGIVLMSGKYLS
jgi:hypothetical protein